MRISLIGTRGVPATYGGFETAAEEIGRRLVERGHEVVVYCRHPTPRVPAHHGMKLVHLPALRAKALETLSHTALSALDAVARRRPDVAIVFNGANAPLLPLLRLRRIPVALHVDGLEWRRSKWGRVGRRYYLCCEWLGTRLCRTLIADARGIHDYYRDRYGVAARTIAYGAPILDGVAGDRVGELGLEAGGFHLVVARLEPENNVAMAVAGRQGSAASLPLVVVGDAPYVTPEIASLRESVAGDERVRMVGAVYDQELLDQLYAHCASYVHGHSVGGTNPSLLRAMGAGAPVLAFDVVFNREVAGDTGRYYASSADLSRLLEEVEADAEATRARGRLGRSRVQEHYDWETVTDGYEAMCLDLLRRAPTARR